VAAAVVVRRGPRWYLVRASGERPSGFSSSGGPESAARAFTGAEPPTPLVAEVARLAPDVEVVGEDPASAAALSERTRRPVRSASNAELRRARERIPDEPAGEERAFVLAVARAELDRALRSPEEILITLAREEERVERAVGREERAADAFLPAAVRTLAEYGEAWEGLRAHLREHHARLREALNAATVDVVPNLAALVGERVAARMVSLAGGLGPLSRMRAPRLQLLGSRRRPSPERGPRFGVLYRAARMEEVPFDRRAAYARSLGALAAIAVRADATTHSHLSRLLTARRDRRVAQLQRARP
jgi:hypothetical protein